MPYLRYLLFDILGGVFWIGTMILSGYSLAHLIPNISQRIHYVILVVIFLSLLPAIISILRARRAEQLPAASPVTTPEKP
jgi:membrane-associated protein